MDKESNVFKKIPQTGLKCVVRKAQDSKEYCKERRAKMPPPNSFRWRMCLIYYHYVEYFPEDVIRYVL
jgi:hypothetical protein